jgi:hypothetical protein
MVPCIVHIRKWLERVTHIPQKQAGMQFFFLQVYIKNKYRKTPFFTPWRKKSSSDSLTSALKFYRQLSDSICAMSRWSQSFFAPWRKNGVLRYLFLI